jgi:hypothetical protein
MKVTRQAARLAATSSPSASVPTTTATALTWENQDRIIVTASAVSMSSAPSTSPVSAVTEVRNMPQAAATTKIGTTKAHGRELVDWLARSDDEERELIVEAVLPARKVTMKQHGGRLLPTGIRVAVPAPSSALDQLYDDLSQRLPTQPTLLKAARAVAILANSRDVRDLMEHPLVKAVRLNRPLRVRR